LNAFRSKYLLTLTRRRVSLKFLTKSFAVGTVSSVRLYRYLLVNIEKKWNRYQQIYYTSAHSTLLLIRGVMKWAKIRITRYVMGRGWWIFVTPTAPSTDKGNTIIIWYCSAENNTKKALSTVRSHSTLYCIIIL